MKLIKPKYQYFILWLYYPLIGFISIFNFIKIERNRHAIIILLIIIGAFVFFDMLIPLIINEKLQIDLHNQLSFSGRLYLYSKNIIIGAIFILDQKKNIDFSSIIKN
ncbi:MAG: hypothetical protein ACYCYI_05665 [Saccharofermentanales bacterium]